MNGIPIGLILGLLAFGECSRCASDPADEPISAPMGGPEEPEIEVLVRGSDEREREEAEQREEAMAAWRERAPTVPMDAPPSAEELAIAVEMLQSTCVTSVECGPHSFTGVHEFEFHSMRCWSDRCLLTFDASHPMEGGADHTADELHITGIEQIFTCDTPDGDRCGFRVPSESFYERFYAAMRDWGEADFERHHTGG